MSEYNTPIAKLGKRVLIAKEADVPRIGKEQAIEVMVEQWDLETGQLEGEFRLEQLLKFNPWEDITDIGEIEEVKARLGRNPEIKKL